MALADELLKEMNKLALIKELFNLPQSDDQVTLDMAIGTTDLVDDIYDHLTNIMDGVHRLEESAGVSA